MRSAAQNQAPDVMTELTSDIRSNSNWFLALGILQVIVGILALGFAFSATIASVAVLGTILLLAAGAQIAGAFLARSWTGFFLFLLVGILYGVTGVLTLAHPVAAAAGLTLMIAAALLVGGIFRIAVALDERFPSWGTVLMNGVVDILLGVLILMQWPLSGLWVLGVFVGIDLIANGITWSKVATEVRSEVARFESR